MPEISTIQFPEGLLSWAGHQAGGVRRLFDEQSGRPNNQVLRTSLLERLRIWSTDIANGASECPRILLLVGGPGNGKTEAIENTINWLDDELQCGGVLTDEVRRKFRPAPGDAVQRVITIRSGSTARRELSIRIVQDASTNSGADSMSPAELLMRELAAALSEPSDSVYLCCVNRGILDDALIHAQETSDSSEALLDLITQAVSLDPEAPSCWPLQGFPSVALWPMDVESLLVPVAEGEVSPAATLFTQAVDTKYWSGYGSCPAGLSCPFCTSQAGLVSETRREALLKILRMYELVSGKRWSFREIFSLISYLLAGHHTRAASGSGPCSWAAALGNSDADMAAGGTVNKENALALFSLVAAEYQHALFHLWQPEVAKSLYSDLKELKLTENSTAMGLFYFLQSRRLQHIPTTVAPLLDALCTHLDPALASPDVLLTIDSNPVSLRALDSRFSRSVYEGIDFIGDVKWLSKNEKSLLQRLAVLDRELLSAAYRKGKPACVKRLQGCIRDFANRLVRRSLGAKVGYVCDDTTLTLFRQIVDEKTDHDELLAGAAKQVQNLLNKNNEFDIPLNTTFGQPLPPRARQATLIVARCKVVPLPISTAKRPKPPVRFLGVGSGKARQPLAVTYDLYKAVSELDAGLSVSSLPRSIVALLDTTRARLSGPMVRDPDILDGSSISIGENAAVVEFHRGRFTSHIG